MAFTSYTYYQYLNITRPSRTPSFMVGSQGACVGHSSYLLLRRRLAPFVPDPPGAISTLMQNPPLSPETPWLEFGEFKTLPQTAVHCTALHCCTASLHWSIALKHCTAALYCHTALQQCTAALHCSTALQQFTAVLHCSTALQHFTGAVQLTLEIWHTGPWGDPGSYPVGGKLPDWQICCI